MDIDKFHEWVETQSPLALREYIHAQAAWQARGALDAKKIKELEQPTQEPVLYIDGGGLDGHATWAQAIRCQDTDIALYTKPPSRKWVGLSDEEIEEAVNYLNVKIDYPIMFARLIEMHLKEKNG